MDVALRRAQFLVPLSFPTALSANGVSQHATRTGKTKKGQAHWTDVNAARKLVRNETAKACAVYAPTFKVQRVRVSVVMRVCRTQIAAQLYPAYRPDDPGNLVIALKPFFDGLVDAGVAPDDKFRYMKLGDFDELRVPNARDEGLFVTLEELEPLPVVA